ncbi:hypothetical protein F4778DRAFT_778434 [Xylariomycetidae sp. FL2044]|nr:hypothetical protein F4778DRAFT_778434 [Xylariomycetidae sp. FL2044]
MVRIPSLLGAVAFLSASASCAPWCQNFCVNIFSNPGCDEIPYTYPTDNSTACRLYAGQSLSPSHESCKIQFFEEKGCLGQVSQEVQGTGCHTPDRPFNSFIMHC